MAKILVVDDEPGYLELLDLILKTDGHEIKTSQTGTNAVETGQPFCPDLLLTDWMLKDELNGLDVAKSLGVINHKLVTIIMTGYSAAKLRSQAQDVRNLYILEKPFNIDTLRNLVNQVMGFEKKSC